MAENQNIESLVQRYRALNIAGQIDYDKFYLYSIITHSTAIEGSTVTEIENQLLFDEGISPAGKTVVEQLMNLDLKAAYDHWLPWAKGNVSFSVDTLCQMSAYVMRRTGTVYHTVLGDFDSSRGELRKLNVRAGVSGRSYMAFQKVPVRLKEFCDWLNREVVLVGQTDVTAAYRLSFAAHYRLVTIHPWVDGNGRTARLFMNLLQTHFGLPMSIVQKELKAKYIQALVDAREKEDENIFVDTMMAMHQAELSRQIEQYESDTNANVTDNVTDNLGNVTDNLSATQQRILQLLCQQPDMSQSQIAEIVGIHRINVNRNIKQLVSMGLLRRIGSDRKGQWIVTEKGGKK